jgi:GMP synthase (glutamine-hydrolysing)
MLPKSGVPMPTILLLQVGHTYESVAQTRGDYDAWFTRALAVPGLRVESVPIYQGAQVPDHWDYAGVVVTGSFAMVTDHAPWSEACAAYLRSAFVRNLPILGVCYGHQLLAYALGGEVANNPQGRHAGTAHISTTHAARTDALFGALPEALVVQVSHLQHVARLPEQAVHLAYADGDPHQAFRVGERAWGVQFHPEFDAFVARSYIEIRRPIIEGEGVDVDALLAAVEDSDHGARLLARFAEIASCA